MKTNYSIIQSIPQKKRRFTPEEDDIIKRIVGSRQCPNWEEVAKYVPGRTSRQCRDRYNSYLFKEVKQRPWTIEEDTIIVEKYKLFGPKWVKISQFLNDRNGNQVKNRWHKGLVQYHGIEHGNIKQERRSKKVKWTTPTERKDTNIETVVNERFSINSEQCARVINS